MRYEEIKNTKDIRVVKYLNPIWKWEFYIMYLYKKKLLEAYKQVLWDSRYRITKIYFLKWSIKVCYKKGFQSIHRIEYYNYFRKIGIKDLIDLWKE